MLSAESMRQMTLSDFREESSSRIGVVRKDVLEMFKLDTEYLARRGG